MIHYPHERDTYPNFPSSADRWARLEAKSDAMVDDVLAASGAAASNAMGNPVARRWQLAAVAVVVLATFVWVVASVIFTIPPPQPESNTLRDHVANLDEAPTHEHPPRNWGPFRP